MRKYWQRLRLGNEVKNVDQGEIQWWNESTRPWPMSLFRFSVEQILSRSRLGLETVLKNEILYGAQKCMEVAKGKGTVDRFSFRFYGLSRQISFRVQNSAVVESVVTLLINSETKRTKHIPMEYIIQEEQAR